MGGGCAPSPATHSTETYSLTVRFTLWTNKGNAIMSATGTCSYVLFIYLLGGKLFLGGENSRPRAPSV